MKQVRQKLHRDLKPTKVWGYEGTYPGPTFEVRKGELVKVKWINQLPKKHFLTVDKSITGNVPEVTCTEADLLQIATVIPKPGLQKDLRKPALVLSTKF